MNMFPAPLLLLPDPRFLEATGTEPAPVVFSLDKPDIGHHRHIITEHANLGRADRRLVATAGCLSLKIKLVKRHPLD